ncbi:MAG: hypothetical protein ACJ786_29645 [Catenulispora sp.]
MDGQTSASAQPSPAGPGAPGFRRIYPAPGLWPTSNPLRVGAATFIAVMLGVVLLLAFRPWSSGGDETPSYPYGQGSAVHGGQQR